MKNTILLLTAFLFAACNNASQPATNGNSVVASNQTAGKQETVIAHSSDSKTAPMADQQTTGRGRWTQSGEPIDTKEFDDNIASAEKAYKAKPGDGGAKQALAEAYYKRAVALTDARQYASALGDYRRTLKYDPDKDEAKEWIDMIIGIYNDMGRESPPEGQEPPPLPFKTDK